ncbi:unnamed protein product [Diamesa serratosioi]
MAKLIILLFAVACATVISAEFKDSHAEQKHDQQMIQNFHPRPRHSSEEADASGSDEHVDHPPYRPPHGPPHRPPHHSNKPTPEPTTTLAPEEPETITSDIEVETTTQ